MIFLLMIKCAVGHTAEVRNLLVTHSEVSHVWMTLGRWDLIAEVHCAKPGDYYWLLEKFIRFEAPGTIASHETLTVVSEISDLDSLVEEPV